MSAQMVTAAVNLILGPLAQVLSQELDDESGDAAHLKRIAEMASLVAWATERRLEAGHESISSSPTIVQQYVLSAIILIWGAD